MTEPREQSQPSTRTSEIAIHEGVIVKYDVVIDASNDPVFQHAPAELLPVAVWVSDPAPGGKRDILVSGALRPEIRGFFALHEYLEFVRDEGQTACVDIEKEVLALVPEEHRAEFVALRQQMFTVLISLGGAEGVLAGFQASLEWLSQQQAS